MKPADLSPRSPARRVPSYRRKTVKGAEYAVVTLPNAATGYRRDVSLGIYGSPESLKAYTAAVAQWQASGGVVAECQDRAGMTLEQLAPLYCAWASDRYGRSEASTIREATEFLVERCGSVAVSEFTPMLLLAYRVAAFKKWSRKHAMGQTNRVKAMFRWTVSRGHAAESVYGALRCLERPRRDEGRANPKIESADLGHVAEIRQFLARPLQLLIDLQLLTGCRPGELLGLRPCDIETGNAECRMQNAERGVADQAGIWTATLEHHKTEEKGKVRVLYFGPKAQPLLAEAMAGRPVDGPIWPGAGPGGRMTANGYGEAVRRVCDHLYPLPAELQRLKIPFRGKLWRWERPAEWKVRLGLEGMAKVRAWHRSHRWNPYQLRHTTATMVDGRFGLEASQVLLGHSSAKVTVANYLDKRRRLAEQVVRAVG